LFWSLCYLGCRCVLQLMFLRPRPREFKDLEIVVLRHELALLRRQTRRPRLTTCDRVFLAAASRLLLRSSWQSFLVTPTTLLWWQRRLVARRWTYRGRGGRPPISSQTRKLMLRLARENPRWGYQRLVGELNGLGINVSATSVRKLLREAGFGPGGSDPDSPGAPFCDAGFDHARGRLLHGRGDLVRRLYVLFLIEIGSRRVQLAGCTANPSGAWVTQQARQFAWTLQERRESFQFLIRDRDSKFTRDFDTRRVHKHDLHADAPIRERSLRGPTPLSGCGRAERADGQPLSFSA
jgi:putative transposase